MAAGGDSPLTTRRDDDRRDAPRVNILGTLRAEALVTHPLDITDINGAGLQALSTFPFQLDVVHEFRLTLDGLTVVVKGRVVHSSVLELDQEGVLYRTGVHFVDATDATKQALELYANRLKQHREG